MTHNTQQTTERKNKMRSCNTGVYAIVHYGDGTALSPCYLRKQEREDRPVAIKFSFNIINALFSENYAYMRNMCDDFNSQLKDEGHKLGGHLMVVEIGLKRVER